MVLPRARASRRAREHKVHQVMVETKEVLPLQREQRSLLAARREPVALRREVQRKEERDQPRNERMHMTSSLYEYMNLFSLNIRNFNLFFSIYSRIPQQRCSKMFMSPSTYRNIAQHNADANACSKRVYHEDRRWFGKWKTKGLASLL